MPKDNSVYTEPADGYGQKIKSKPVPEKQIGLDTQDKFYDDLISSAVSKVLDVSAFTNFDQASMNRDSIYALIDTMCQDSTISAVLETFVADAIEPNDSGQIVWADSSDANVSKYVNYLLDSMRVDKHVGRWVNCLCKYGDVYLRIYRESEYDDGLFARPKNPSKPLREDVNSGDILPEDVERQKLEEQVNLKAYSKDDHYVQYLEMQANPAQVFELTKFGKTYAYIKTNVRSTSSTNNNSWDANMGAALGNYYKFNRGDIDVYAATEFVHGCLDEDQSRTPEEVSISLDSDKTVAYTVKRGQSLFYDSFKVWRELLLLKNSVLLNRVTRSSVVRAIQVEVGDMPKEEVAPHLQGVKRLFEQSQSIIAGKGMSEYTNPGPIENNVYISTRNGKGAISVQQVGGDGTNVSQLADLDYYTRCLFGSLGVPKEFFGFTEDNAGFSGGESLAQISSRYAKRIRKIQSVLTQTLTDAINILLLDRGLDNYINKFTIKMQAPATKDEVAKREMMANRVQLTTEIVSSLDIIEDPITKLKILKSLYSDYINNTEVLDLIQQEIDKMEQAQEAEEDDASVEDAVEETGALDDEPLFGDLESSLEDETSSEGSEESLEEEPISSEEEVSAEPSNEESEYETLPTPNQLGLDFTDSGEF